jgi:hypothetical protein
MDVAICPFAEGPVEFFMWDLIFLVLTALLMMSVVVWAAFCGAVDPMEVGM